MEGICWGRKKTNTKLEVQDTALEQSGAFFFVREGFLSEILLIEIPISPRNSVSSECFFRKKFSFSLCPA